MDRNPVVYVIAEPTIPKKVPKRVIDLSSLYEHSRDIRFLVKSNQYPTFIEDGLYHQIKAGLRDFNPTIDYLVWAGGDALAAVNTGLVLAEMGVKEFTWLRHDRDRLPDGTRDPTQGRYVPINIKI